MFAAFLMCLVGADGCSGNRAGSTVPTAFSLRSDFGTKAAQGSNMSFTATVPGTGGSVAFSDGSTSLGSATVTNSKANLQTTSLVPGTHTITAVYQPSTGSPLTATLQQGITGTAIVQVTGTSARSATPSTSATCCSRACLL